MGSKFTNSLVSGYVREHRRSLKLTTIPILITYLIAGFYHLQEFIKKAREDRFRISNDKLTVTNVCFCAFREQGIYLNERIDSMSDYSFTWTFRINKLKHRMYFGLVSKHAPLHNYFLQTHYKPCYQISNKRSVWKYVVNTTNWISNPMRPDLVFGTGDEVSFTLDLKQQTLSCTINNDKGFVLFDDIDKKEELKWGMCLAIQEMEDSISLLQFYQHS